VLGWRAGIPVFAFDVFKGWLAVKAADFLLALPADDPYLLMWKIIMAAAVVLGHVFPVFAGFRGGKGVATMLGVGMALYPVTVWVVLLVFILVLLITGYVSLGSITAAVAFPFIDIFLFQQPSGLLIGLSVFVALFIPVTHRKNIIRLLKGEESKFRPGKSKKMPDH
jgi:acyl phosphate:glycerol-3-phosphate acyltransferase